jgi:hypothetical protein
MKIAISQPRYLPALNYLQRIVASDKFVLLDDVQHQSRAFEHRNKVRDNKKSRWLSIPIDRSITSRPLLKEMRVADQKWIEDHKNFLRAYYKTSPFFDIVLLDDLYKDLQNDNYFVDIAEKQLLRILDLLNLSSGHKLLRSSDLGLLQSGSNHLASLTKSLGGNVYISGPNGRDYINKGDFDGIQVVYHEFCFPKYDQHNQQFIPWLAWIDCLFNVGIEKTRKIITSNVNLSSI